MTNPLNSESGIALVITLFVLAVLTLTAVSNMEDTAFELKTAANDKAAKIAFFNAQSGVSAAKSLISQTIESGDLLPQSDIGALKYTGGNFYRQVEGLDTYDDGAADFEFKNGTYDAWVDVFRVGEKNIDGNIAVRYLINSSGNGPGGAVDNISQTYTVIK